MCAQEVVAAAASFSFQDSIEKKSFQRENGHEKDKTHVIPSQLNPPFSISKPFVRSEQAVSISESSLSAKAHPPAGEKKPINLAYLLSIATHTLKA